MKITISLLKLKKVILNNKYLLLILKLNSKVINLFTINVIIFIKFKVEIFRDKI